MSAISNKQASEDDKKKFKEVMEEAKKDDQEFRTRSEDDRKKRLKVKNTLQEAMGVFSTRIFSLKAYHVLFTRYIRFGFALRCL